MSGPNLVMQNRITIILLMGYFVVLFTMIAIAGALVAWLAGDIIPGNPFDSLPAWAGALLAWMQGVLGSQIGTLTGSVKDALQFQFGSSVGSKTKDFATAHPERVNQ